MVDVLKGMGFIGNKLLELMRVKKVCICEYDYLVMGGWFKKSMISVIW